jgi:hypothetical protein
MRSTLVNVRLDAERRRKAKALRARGITLSDVVRDAIDERFRAIDQSASKPDVRALIAQLFTDYPDPENLPARDYEVHNRRAARLAIRRKIDTRRT